MRLPFEEYSPSTSPDRMLAAIRREAGRRRLRRRLTAGSLAAVALVSTGMFLFRTPPAEPVPLLPTRFPVVREAWQDGQAAPFTLLQLKNGSRVIVILSKEGGKS